MDDGVNPTGQLSPGESANPLAVWLVAFKTAFETLKRAEDRRGEIPALGVIVKQKSAAAGAEYWERNRCKSDAERERYPQVRDIPEQCVIERIGEDIITAFNEVCIQRASLPSHPVLLTEAKLNSASAFRKHIEALTSDELIIFVSTAVAASHSSKIDAVAPKRHGGKSGNPEVASLRQKVQRIYRESKDPKLRLSYKDLCGRLDAKGIGRPPGAKWKGLGLWATAYRLHRPAVSKWISTAVRSKVEACIPTTVTRRDSNHAFMKPKLK